MIAPEQGVPGLALHFDLNADSKTVEIVEGNATSFQVRSVYDIR